MILNELFHLSVLQLGEGNAILHLKRQTIFLNYHQNYIGEGDGTLLQYSCLENPMDGGAW